jgi:hypothetical protein
MLKLTDNYEELSRFYLDIKIPLEEILFFVKFFIQKCLDI